MSNLIQIPGWGNIILDAGEGTWGQLVRMFGLDDTSPNNVWTVLRDVKCIFISHIHGDHHMGLGSILEKRRLVRCLLITFSLLLSNSLFVARPTSSRASVSRVYPCSPSLPSRKV